MADAALLDAQGHRHGPDVHAHQGIADVDGSLRLYGEGQGRLLQHLPRSRGDAAARLGLGNRLHLHQETAAQYALLHDDGAVQMLAALEGRVQAALAAGFQHRLGDDLAQLGHAALADARAGHFAGGAAQHDQAAGSDLARLLEGFDGGVKGGKNLILQFGGHGRYLLAVCSGGRAGCSGAPAR